MSQTVPQSPLTPQSWPFDLECLPQSTYLVGGCVRDALLGRDSPYLDLDFVLPEQSVATAAAIAKQCQAGFVLLDAERQIARIVFANATADFALQVGCSLSEDLNRRDFTINAIAYNPHTQKIIDPLQGQQDLQQNLIRMVHPHNLLEDPLRLLRAYRQAAQLTFTIEPQTEAIIHQLAPHLQGVAAERVRAELSYLLSHPQGTPWLQVVWQQGLLKNWFSQATIKGLRLIAAVDQATLDLKRAWPELYVALKRSLNAQAQGPEAVRRTLLATTKLLGLLPWDVTVAKQTLQHLKFSRAEVNVVVNLLQCLPLIPPTAEGWPPLRRSQYYLFQNVGTNFPGLVVLAMALGQPMVELAPLIEEYLQPDSAIAHPQPLVSGEQLMKVLALRPGPHIGQLLTQLEAAQAEGKITTLQEALEFATHLCHPNR
ncbi:CCA tRNA nucleotidyltransferase [Synechococcales cyanobacterium C]|uniref:CCA tRNA nucleotidyltransferase n=1 Tax=Petrachloros mirabilis ULC683 TaxID=2781853 RepID=A0A8K2A8Q8_9CYAN|nr:CCA tRNA nucleotidyltransferase [Petrachloros mirabilis]NCJ07190.1 CCA tRNA nucleotidyltransferase [Petrachloros mirabilis ULC683]